MLLSQDTRVFPIENLLFSCSQWVPRTLSCFSDLSPLLHSPFTLWARSVLPRTHTSVEGKSPLPPSAVLHLSHRLGLPCWSSFGSTATSAVFPIHLFLVSFIHSPFHLLGTEKVSSDSLIALTDFCMVIDFT